MAWLPFRHFQWQMYLSSARQVPPAQTSCCESHRRNCILILDWLRRRSVWKQKLRCSALASAAYVRIIAKTINPAVSAIKPANVNASDLIICVSSSLNIDILLPFIVFVIGNVPTCAQTSTVSSSGSKEPSVTNPTYHRPASSETISTDATPQSVS